MDGSNTTVSSALRDTGIEESPVFPLPLTPFERYMYLDDRDDYPMAFVITIRLKGWLFRDEFEEALRVVVARHPLLGCRVQSFLRGGLCWVQDERLRPQLDWADDDRPLVCLPQERIDLTREIGLRIWVRRSPDNARVSFQFHHSCTDGLGAVQFIGDLLAVYGQQTVAVGDEAPELEPIEPARLKLRGTFSTGNVRVLLQRMFMLLRRRPVPLAAAREVKQSTVSDLMFPATVSRVLNRSVLNQLKLLATQKMVALNDLYLLEMFQTIRAWNRDHGAHRDHHYLQIGMPTSLRMPLHDQMPAANAVSFVFLNRRAGFCERSDELLQDIHRQTTAAVNEQEGRFLATGLKCVARIPGLLKLVLGLNRCFATVVLANVGDIRRQFTAKFPLKQGRCVAGNIVLESLEGAAPVRPNTRMAISLGTYAGSLYINMHCDPRSFTRDQAEKLADRYLERLQQLTVAATDTLRQVA